MYIREWAFNEETYTGWFSAMLFKENINFNVARIYVHMCLKRFPLCNVVCTTLPWPSSPLFSPSANSSVIQRGPGVKDIGCGGTAQQVREAFAGVMHAVVELASKQPSKCINTIAMLCVVPYTRSVRRREAVGGGQTISQEVCTV